MPTSSAKTKKKNNNPKIKHLTIDKRKKQKGKLKIRKGKNPELTNQAPTRLAGGKKAPNTGTNLRPTFGLKGDNAPLGVKRRKKN